MKNPLTEINHWIGWLGSLVVIVFTLKLLGNPLSLNDMFVLLPVIAVFDTMKHYWGLQ